ncbi:MAG: LLM class F420-dependent oxidoreductase [Anaerolineae bacterium]|nr:LLM class F420-dependent oxidoreductase [Anaerolineae bacterium]
MQFGLVFPQTEISANPADIRAYVQAAEDMGFDYILAYDHVLGANPDRPGGWSGPYTYQTQFHEIFTLFGFMAGVSDRLSFVTGILILPQRQTALVAKQAAQIDVLTNGRFRLGIGVGWNQVEMEGLGETFSNRGKRVEEQIDVLRLLWSQELVKFDGKYHHLDDVGLRPMPVQQPIPIWMGGAADAVLRRIARKGDGWIPNSYALAQIESQVTTLFRYMEEEGRDPSKLGIDARVNATRHTQAEWLEYLAFWRKWGGTHFALDTMGGGFTSLQQHLDAAQDFITRVREA